MNKKDKFIPPHAVNVHGKQKYRPTHS